MTIITSNEQGGVVVGVDTHADQHTAAVMDRDGKVLDLHQFPTTAGGYQALLVWAQQWPVTAWGVESSGSYGAGLCRVLRDHGHTPTDVALPDVLVRARQGKSDTIDAVMAADAVRSGRAQTMAKDTRSVVESIRLLLITRESAVKARSVAYNQLRDLVTTAPTALRDSLPTGKTARAAACRGLRPDSTRLVDPTQAAKAALRSVARRIDDLDTEIKALDAALNPMVAGVAPRLLARPQVGPLIAARILVTLGCDPQRVPTDAKFARLTGVAPIPASSGHTTRMRLHRGGDRQANKALHLVAVGRKKNHPPAIDYFTKRTNAGLSKRDTIRAMKRLIARELFYAAKADLTALNQLDGL